MRLLFCSTVISSLSFLLSAQDAGRGGAPGWRRACAAGYDSGHSRISDGGHIPVKFSQAAPGVAPGGPRRR